MSVERERFSFPTRSYPYRRFSAGVPEDESVPLSLEAHRVHRFVMGLDDVPSAMTAQDVRTWLGDLFATRILTEGVFPLTLRTLLAAVDALGAEGLPDQKCFLAADGGQIQWQPETASVNRFFRFVIARLRHGEAELLVAASTLIDSEAQFLQLIAWDPAHAAYNFYERRAGTWIWAGQSGHALEPATRGRGPFDSHVNGALVMKELKAPWMHWHSMAAHIDPGVLSPNDPLRLEPLFVERRSADELETQVVRPGIQRWNRARLARAMTEEAISDVPLFLQQVLETTTVNLVTSPDRSGALQDGGDLHLPTTFFLNTDGLLDIAGLEPEIAPISVPGEFYRRSLARYGFSLTDGSYRQDGDTFFAFLVPEPAFEDLDVLALLVRERVLGRKFAACLLMVDFPNPVFSSKRAQLLAYAPKQVRFLPTAEGVRTDLEQRFVEATRAARAPTGSAEAEFLANWDLPNSAWKSVFEQRIVGYFQSLSRTALTESGFDGWVRLAECRRRQFRRRPLAEFPLTMPTTSIPEDAPALAMQEDGTATEVA